MRSLDCIVCGEICLDLVVQPVTRDKPLNQFVLHRVEPIRPVTGGIVPNSGLALSRLGMRAAALGYVGDDEWGSLIRNQLESEGLDIAHVLTYASASTSVTVVLVDATGEHTFAFHAGASQYMDRPTCLDRLDLFAQSRFALFGYYSLFPQLEEDLPDVLAAIRQTGCRTALDAAGDGGALQPLDRVLPHLDLYVPSLAEASAQTGETDPEKILRAYRDCGTDAILGVKLGARGVMLNPAGNELIPVAPISPPGAIVDTTGAGDSFYAGLITGLIRGMDPADAARLGAAAGACCVTGMGASTGIRDFEQTLALAGE